MQKESRDFHQVKLIIELERIEKTVRCFTPRQFLVLDWIHSGIFLIHKTKKAEKLEFLGTLRP
jgi:hypothetical protein